MDKGGRSSRWGGEAEDKCPYSANRILAILMIQIIPIFERHEILELKVIG